MTTNEFDKIPVGKRYTSKNSALTAMIPHLSNCDGLHLLLSGLYVYLLYVYVCVCVCVCLGVGLIDLRSATQVLAAGG